MQYCTSCGLDPRAASQKGRCPKLTARHQTPEAPVTCVGAKNLGLRHPPSCAVNQLHIVATVGRQARLTGVDAWALVKKPSFISDKSLVGRRPTHLILRLTILAAATLAILSCKPDNQINVTSTPPESDEDSNSPEVFLTIIDNIGRYSLVRQEDFVSLLWASSQPVEVSLDYSSDGVVWNEFAVVPAGTSDYTFRGLDSSIPMGT